MPRTRRILTTITVEENATQPKFKRPTLKSWEKAMLTGDPDRQRTNLTKGQWVEYSELRHSLPIQAEGIIIEDASLETLRDLNYSIKRMQILRIVHNQQMIREQYL